MRPVFIYKLLTENTVDEHIYRMASSKRERNDLVMGDVPAGEIAPAPLAETTSAALDAEEKLSIGQVLASLFQTKTELKAES